MSGGTLAVIWHGSHGCGLGCRYKAITRRPRVLEIWEHEAEIERRIFGVYIVGDLIVAKQAISR